MGEEQVIDAIPLSEIKSIEGVTGVGSDPLDMAEMKNTSNRNFRECDDTPISLDGKR